MSTFSDYLEAAVLNHFFRNVATAAPPAVFVALFTTDTGEAGGGVEVAGNNYSRKAITFNAPADQGAAKRVVQAADVLFDVPSGPGWGTITNYGIFDAAAAGNLLAYGGLPDISVGAGQQPRVPSGTITVDLS